MTVTTEQLKEMSDFMVLLRQTSGEFGRAMNHMEALNTAWLANVSADISALGSGQIITDNTGLSGAVPLTTDQATNIVSYFQNILSAYNDTNHRQVLSLACGAINLIG